MVVYDLLAKRQDKQIWRVLAQVFSLEKQDSTEVLQVIGREQMHLAEAFSLKQTEYLIQTVLIHVYSWMLEAPALQ